MQRKYLVVLLKSVLAGCAVLVIGICAFLVPGIVRHLTFTDSTYFVYALPVRLFCWLLTVPILCALVFAWRIFDSIGKDESFTEDNARRLRWVYRLALTDLLLLMIGFLLTWFASLMDPFALLVFLVGGFLCIVAAVFCLVLSQLIHQAAMIKTENDYTI